VRASSTEDDILVLTRSRVKQHSGSDAKMKSDVMNITKCARLFQSPNAREMNATSLADNDVMTSNYKYTQVHARTHVAALRW
jgi:hypothetical protein